MNSPELSHAGSRSFDAASLRRSDDVPVFEDLPAAKELVLHSTGQLVPFQGRLPLGRLGLGCTYHERLNGIDEDEIGVVADVDRALLE